ncbi:MAG: hypothetical protein OJJ54_07225 [Pseudonocardia sp.]|nr:hypothetical protein [Pseudonocardia sp.]
MLLLVLILVLIAFGLLVVALLSGSVVWAWVSVAVSVAAAVSLLVDWLHRRSAVKAGSDTGTGTAAAAQAAGGVTAPPAGAPAVGRAPADYYEPVTEVIPIVPGAASPGSSGTASTAGTGAAESPDTSETSSPERGSSVFAAGADAEVTTVMPVVQPPGSAEQPSSATEGDTRSGDKSSPSVTESPSDADPSTTPVGGPEEPSHGVEDASTTSSEEPGDTGSSRAGAPGVAAAGAGLAAAAAKLTKNDDQAGPEGPQGRDPEDRADATAGAATPAEQGTGPAGATEAPSAGTTPAPADVEGRSEAADAPAVPAAAAGPSEPAGPTDSPRTTGGTVPDSGRTAEPSGVPGAAVPGGEQGSLGGADLFASFSDGGKGRAADTPSAPVDRPAQASEGPADDEIAARAGRDIDGPTVVTRVPGAESQGRPGTPSGGQTREPAGTFPAGQSSAGQQPAGQGPSAQNAQGGVPGGAPGQDQAFAGRSADRGPQGSGAPQGDRLPPAGPDGEAPEEPRDAEAAALVAELGDEVLVIDEQPRYHLAGCRSLPGRAIIPIAAKEAVELGFTPCGWCSPDRNLARRHSAEVR